MSSTTARPLDTSNGSNIPPRARPAKRLGKVQIVRLEQLYQHTSKPSRQDREALATELNLQAQVVTTWFKNKQKQNPTRHDIATSTTTNRRSASSTASSRRPSLDYIASRSELRAPAPRTPRQQKFNPHAPLWANMQSSPPSSPRSNDDVAFGAPHRVGSGSLEWACARRRQRTRMDDEENIPGLVLDEAGGDTTDTEDVHEAVTPPGSCISSQRSSRSAVGGKKSAAALQQEPDEDTMKAALALCGLMHG